MTIRLYIVIRGAVQGVGFRPFIHRLASELDLKGWVSNSPQGVFVEVEGERCVLEKFFLRIQREKPPLAFIQSLEPSYLDAVGYKTFEIRESKRGGEKSAIVLPDAALCPDCLRELFDSTNRRYRYPFINCTNCGPRYSIIEALPYDRPFTSMKGFLMCPECRAEYENPNNRRFHAQPIACPNCGPRMELWNSKGEIVAVGDSALFKAVAAIRDGTITAVKGLGGFHLIVEARNEQAVVSLRRRKHREEKPFALMFPSLGAAMEECEISDMESRLLLSTEAPIVLLRRKHHDPDWNSSIASAVAPRNPNLGVMLPYTPLHHLLMHELDVPVVATSGNLSDEPICIDEDEALLRLAGIADLFLVHNRPIVRPVDDSVVRIMAGRELVLRRARGYAPLPMTMKEKTESAILAVGAHQKNSIALSRGKDVILSQHIGDLDTKESIDAFRRTNDDLENLFDIKPDVICSDAHPDYYSTRFAGERAGTKISVQHHHAHVASCMAENQIDGPVLGVSWDGTGYGNDGTIWGGEFLLMSGDSFSRVAHLRHFRLPGGEKAIHEPRRTAIGALFEIFDDSIFQQNELHPLKSFSPAEAVLLRQMLTKRINSPLTSSAGRLFDVVASLTRVCDIARYEGQGAMELEWCIGELKTDEAYAIPVPHDESPMVLDWGLMLLEILADVARNVPAPLISIRFHNALAESIVEVARRVGQRRVVLSGGCFQNKYLLEEVVARLEEEGFRPYWHQRIPPNDGGIALGQVWVGNQALKRKHDSVAKLLLTESVT